MIKLYNDFFFVNAGEEIIPCKIRGLIKRDKRSGTAIYPGDYVEISRLENNSGVIEKILPRKNLLTRPAVANIDRVVLTFAAANPNFHPLLLNRFIILAEQSKIPEIVICINKTDLIEDGENFLSDYEPLYKIIRVSALTGKNIDALKKILSSGVTVFSGPSGAGKSSLLNAIDSSLNLKTGTVSKKILRGKHTTRFSELLKFANGFFVDTPGFGAVNLSDAGIDKKNLRLMFKEFGDFAGDCKFLNDCSHSHEPDCGIKSAVRSGKILPERYEIYLTLLKELSG